MNVYEEKQEARRERYKTLAAKNAASAHNLHEVGMAALQQIPFGQPILVGHYSEKGDRAYRTRACSKIDRSFDLSKKADYYQAKAESVGTAGISSDDPDAIAKLKAKLEKMQAQWDEIKRQRKEGKDVWAWGVSTANIRNIKKRIEQLEKATTMELRPDVVGDGWKMHESREDNRIQFTFDGKPSDDVRALLKGRGFRWSPISGTWQAFLTGHGRYSAERVMEHLGGASK